MTMSDRLAVMRDGKVEQLGSPSEVYARPATAYVAGFLGNRQPLRSRRHRRLRPALATCTVAGPHRGCRGHRRRVPRGDAAIVVTARADRHRRREHAPSPAGPQPGRPAPSATWSTSAPPRRSASRSAPSDVLLVQVANQAGPRSFTATPGERVACWFSPAAVQVLRRSEAKLPDPVTAELNSL